jgi:hypothetical protein
MFSPTFCEHPAQSAGAAGGDKLAAMPKLDRAIGCRKVFKRVALKFGLARDKLRWKIEDQYEFRR